MLSTRYLGILWPPFFSVFQFYCGGCRENDSATSFSRKQRGNGVTTVRILFRRAMPRRGCELICFDMEFSYLLYYNNVLGFFPKFFAPEEHFIP